MVAPLPPLPDEAHVCESCGTWYAAIKRPDALRAIAAIPGQVAGAVLPLSDDRLRRRPDDKTWSVLEYVCHLRDVYSVYTIRLYRTRVEDRPSLEPMLNDLRAVRFRYNSRELGPVLAELADHVQGFLDETTRVGDQEWGRIATRLPNETRTALWMLRQALHEGKHHLMDTDDVLVRLGPCA